MAGHATNWFTASSGAITGSIYCPPEVVAAAGFVTEAGLSAPAQAQQALTSYAQQVQQTITAAQQQMQNAGLTTEQIAALTPVLILPPPPPGVAALIQHAAPPPGAAKPALLSPGFTAQSGEMFTLDHQTIALCNGPYNAAFAQGMKALQIKAKWYPTHPAGKVWTFPAQHQQAVADLYAQCYGQPVTAVTPPAAAPAPPTGSVPIGTETPFLTDHQPPVATAGSLIVQPVVVTYDLAAQIPAYQVSNSATGEQVGLYLDEASAVAALEQASAVTPGEPTPDGLPHPLVQQAEQAEQAQQALVAQTEATLAAAPLDYATIPDQPFQEPPPPPNLVKSGVVVVEDDGRVWVQQDATSVQKGFSKEPHSGLSAQQHAIQQAHEKLGLQVKLTDYLGDYAASNGQVTRFYIARRTGGSPAAAPTQMQVPLLAALSRARTLAQAGCWCGYSTRTLNRLLADLRDVFGLDRSRRRAAT